MKTKEIIKWAREYSRPFRVVDGGKFRLKDFDPGDTLDFGSADKARAAHALDQGINALAELQDKLYAQDRWGVLVVLQAMDAAGKDSTIKHVMSGVNPQGCEVHSFKAPSSEELDHDYLWRAVTRLPRRGEIGIFNRSYYEEVLIVRVHQNVLQAEKLPRDILGDRKLWSDRLHDIRAFEHYLSRNGILVLKFFLHVSKREQKRRFLERIDDPSKNWKFSLGDLKEREHWDEYMDAYEEAIRETASKHAPWFVVPADNKWFTRIVVAGAIVEALGSLDLAYPTLDPRHRRELTRAKRQLT